MAKVTCSSIQVERRPKAFMHTLTGNIAFPMGDFDTASVMLFDAKNQLAIKSISLWHEFVSSHVWVPLYDGDTIKIAFGESNE